MHFITSVALIFAAFDGALSQSLANPDNVPIATRGSSRLLPSSWYIFLPIQQINGVYLNEHNALTCALSFPARMEVLPPNLTHAHL